MLSPSRLRPFDAQRFDLIQHAITEALRRWKARQVPTPTNLNLSGRSLSDDLYQVLGEVLMVFVISVWLNDILTTEVLFDAFPTVSPKAPG